MRTKGRPYDNKQHVADKIILLRGQEAQLPDDVREAFKTLSMNNKVGYAKRLRAKGWTLESIGNASDVSREAVRLWLQMDREYDYAKVFNLPAPQRAFKVVPVFKHVPRVPSDEVIQQLKQLHSKAKLVRYDRQTHRVEAEQFTALLNEVINVQKYTVLQVAKALGLTRGALHFRLVRYGYNTTSGKSVVYRNLKHRLENK